MVTAGRGFDPPGSNGTEVLNDLKSNKKRGDTMANEGRL
jgi:hypothetical protein